MPAGGRLRALLRAGGAASLVVGSVAGQGPAGAPEPRVRPWIEQKAPRAFDGAVSDPHADARYRIDATVLLPLLPIPIASRDDVGFATAAVRDLPAGGGGDVRSYEFFGASFPERARGLNRMGFFREAVGREGSGAAWTAHFGALSSSPETSRAQVELDGDESVRPYTVLDGFTDRRGSSNRDVRVELTGSWLSADMFYEQLLPVWRVTEPEAESQMPRPEDAEPLGFLAILERALLDAARDLEPGGRLGRARHPFVHKAEPMTLERRGHDIDRGRAERYVELGLVAPSATIHRFDFRIQDHEGDTVQEFRLWTELPTALPDDDAPAHTPMPIGFEFKPKSFLRLEGERISLAPR